MSPSPERIALAYARNRWNDARRYPRDAAVDFALLLFVGLMLLGLQFQVVSKLADLSGDNLQKLVDMLPFAAGALTMFVRGADPASVRRGSQGDWLESLPMNSRTKARWAIRQACYAALMVSVAGSILLLDVEQLEGTPIRVKVQTIGFIWAMPLVIVLLRALFQKNELLEPHEQSEREFARQRDSALRHFAQTRFSNLLARGLTGFALMRFGAAALWTKLLAVIAVTVTLIYLAIVESQAALLLLGVMLAPPVIGSSFEPPMERVYSLARSLPLGFRKLTQANVKTSLLIPLVFGVPFVIAALFAPEGGYWFAAALLTLAGMAALLFLKLLVAQAFPQSRLSQTLFMFAAALGVGVLSMQAPLIAPIIGAILCAGWLMERGWGVWEFGYGERLR